MSAMVDLACKKCRRRFGYAHGQPAKCYHCGTVNDGTEADKVVAEFQQYLGQRDAHDAITAAITKAEPAGPLSKSVIRRVSYGIGADPEDVIAFITKAKPLPAAELEQVRRWMKARA